MRWVGWVENLKKYQEATDKELRVVNPCCSKGPASTACSVRMTQGRPLRACAGGVRWWVVESLESKGPAL